MKSKELSAQPQDNIRIGERSHISKALRVSRNTVTSIIVKEYTFETSSGLVRDSSSQSSTETRILSGQQSSIKAIPKTQMSAWALSKNRIP